MELNLFICTAERNRVDKTDFIGSRFVMNGTLRENCSVIEPIITVEKTNPAEFLYNYMYIPDFKRWYFITDFVSIRNNLWEIHSKVDSLYTWRTDIKQTKAVIDRTESNNYANPYMDDGSYVLDSRKYNTILPFSQGLSENGVFILICAGGDSNVSS